MRWIILLLMAALSAFVVLSFLAPDATSLGASQLAGVTSWFPAEVGRGAETVDRLFDELIWISAGLFALTFLLLGYAVWRGAKRRGDEGSDAAGHHGLELAWTLGPIAILAFLTWSQLDARASIAQATADGADAPPALIVEVEGAQFDWRFTYPGPDGVFGSLDDVTEVMELTVPIGRNVELRMTTVDVLHSFFVPALRIKRDLVPGTVVPLRFAVDPADYAAAGSPSTIELRCAELCGWGHYAMVGRIRPLEPTAFKEWMAATEAARFAGGADAQAGEDFDEDFEDDEDSDED